MAIVSLFWNNNLAALTSCENALYIFFIFSTSTIIVRPCYHTVCNILIILIIIIITFIIKTQEFTSQNL